MLLYCAWLESDLLDIASANFDAKDSGRGVETAVGGVGVGAGVATGETVPTELSETIPGDWTLTLARLSPAMPLGSAPMFTEICVFEKDTNKVAFEMVLLYVCAKLNM